MHAYFIAKGAGAKLLDRCRAVLGESEEVRTAGFARILEKRIIPKLETLFSPEQA